ncbi:MAG: VOC family protein [Dehalococcoidia bacterium]
MIRGIHHIAVNTPDLDRLVDFYVKAFGFEPLRPQVGPGWRDNALIDSIVGLRGSAARSQMLRAGTCYLEVFEYSAPAAREAGAAAPNDHAYTHFGVVVDDIDAECERLAALGMRFTLERPAELGNLKAVYGYDPDGNIIEILQPGPGHDFAMENLAGPR